MSGAEKDLYCNGFVWGQLLLAMVRELFCCLVPLAGDCRCFVFVGLLALFTCSHVRGCVQEQHSLITTFTKTTVVASTEGFETKGIGLDGATLNDGADPQSVLG